MGAKTDKGTAIVTGGTRGIGLAITETLIRDGYNVAAIYHGNDQAAKDCKKKTGASVFKADVVDFDACMAVYKKIVDDMGAVTVLVNNAGITRDGMLHKMQPENWRSVIETNLTSCYNMCRAVLPSMREREFGRIVNISSVNGQKGQLGQANYAAAKAGMLGLTKAAALENAAKGVTVNAICPGYIETEMTAAMRPEVLESIVRQIPVGRMGTSQEIAEMVTFLVSDKGAFANGATFSINGGQYMP
ncbi:MAG TPA: acetoacetyl-CoA reductase [Alphaproteobacteria bacterium]|jgi:acetoacetyl-CoA reductase